MERGLGGEDITHTLDTLCLHGLADRIPEKPDTAEHYTIHDLAYSYTRAQTSDAERHRALDACLAYTARHNEPTLANFAALRPTLPNLLEAAAWAFAAGRYADGEAFIVLYHGPNLEGGFMALQGYSHEATKLLAQAAQTARQRGNHGDESAHLSNLGLAYLELGETDKATEYLEQAYVISSQSSDNPAKNLDLFNLGGHLTHQPSSPGPFSLMEKGSRTRVGFEVPRPEGEGSRVRVLMRKVS